MKLEVVIKLKLSGTRQAKPICKRKDLQNPAGRWQLPNIMRIRAAHTSTGLGWIKIIINIKISPITRVIDILGPCRSP